MSKRLLLLLAVGFFLFASYRGLFRASENDAKILISAAQIPGQTRRSELTRSHPAGLPNDYKRGPRSLPLSPSNEAKKRDGSIPEEDETRQLIDEVLHSSRPEDRAFALSELALLDRTPDLLFACFEALKDPQEDVRVEAVLALEMLEEEAAIPILRRLTDEDPSQDVRDTAAEALEHLLKSH